MATVTLSWSANPGTDNVTQYQVWGAPGTSVAFASCARLLSTDSLNATIGNLAANTAYTFYVVAVNAVGASSPEGPVDITTGATLYGLPSDSATASENIAAGALVNLWDNSGALNMRNANATDTTKPADGFVIAAVTSGNSGTFYCAGQFNTALSGLTPGTRYYLDTSSGRVNATAPSTSGNAVQEIGVALSSSSLYFAPKTPVGL